MNNIRGFNTTYADAPYKDMENVKQLLDTPRTKLRLSEIERLIKKHRIIVPPLSRGTLVNFCEDGTFETAGTRPTTLGWLVYEDSFWRWVRALDGDEG